MILTKIWERYFLKEFLKGFFLFLLVFYGFYILIDYANHTTTLRHHHIHFSWKEFCFYYGCEFLKRMDILLPFAILIATIRTLCNLNVHNELVALIATGLNIKTVMRPFLFVGLVGVMFVYINMELSLPKAMQKLQYFEDVQKTENNRKKDIPSVQHILLEDGSLFLFYHYDSSKKRFFDTYWMRSFDNIYKIKFLDPHSEPPMGYFVDHLVRDKQGNLILNEQLEEIALPDMKFNKKRLIETIIPPENLPLSKLYKKMKNKFSSRSEKEARIQTAFIYKMVLPWLCFLAVIAPAPFCLFFTRHLSVFLIYAASLFGLLTSYLVMDACVILGDKQVMNPYFAMGIPFFLFSSFFLYKFLKI